MLREEIQQVVDMIEAKVGLIKNDLEADYDAKINALKAEIEELKSNQAAKEIKEPKKYSKDIPMKEDK